MTDSEPPPALAGKVGLPVRCYPVLAFKVQVLLQSWGRSMDKPRCLAFLPFLILVYKTLGAMI